MKKLLPIILLCAAAACHAEQPAPEEQRPQVSVQAMETVRAITEALDAGNPQDAEALARQLAASSDPATYDATLANLLLAQSLTAQQRYAEVVAPLGAAVASPFLDQESLERYSTGLAHVHMELGNQSLALETLEKLSSAIPRLRPETHYLYAVILLQAGRAAEARAQADKALQANLQPPTDYYQLLAACAQEVGDYDTAVACIEHLLELKPTNETFWAQLVATQHGQGNTMAALNALMRAQERGLLTAEKYILVRVEMLTSLDRYREAAALLEDGLLNGKLTDTENLWLHWASCLDNLFEPAQAEKVLELASQRTRWGSIEMRLAERYWRAKNYKATMTHLEMAVAKGGIERQGNVWILMASAALELHDLDKADEALNQARQYPDVADKVDRLEKYLKKLRQAAEEKHNTASPA